MSNATTVKLVGVEGILKELDTIPANIQRKFLVKAVRKAANDIKADAQELCPSDIGTLRESIAVKMISSKDGKSAGAIIGPRRGIKEPVRIVARGEHKGQVLVAIPTKYAAAVEFGHKIVTHGGESVGDVSPRPFMRPAWDAFGGEFAIDTITDSLAQDLFG